MTLGAVLETGDVGFDVNARHLIRSMIVAAITGKHCIVRGMTQIARRVFAFVSVIEWKWMLDEPRRRPPIDRVTRRTIGSELSAMHRRVGVTLHAVARRSAETIIDVTLYASDLRVFAHERKNSRVIESFQAIGSVVTRQARIAHFAAMIRYELGVILLMTIHARREHRGGFGFPIRCRKTVTRATRNRRAVKVAFMACQQIAELIVRKVSH